MVRVRRRDGPSAAEGSWLVVAVVLLLGGGIGGAIGMKEWAAASPEESGPASSAQRPPARAADPPPPDSHAARGAHEGQRGLAPNDSSVPIHPPAALAPAPAPAEPWLTDEAAAEQIARARMLATFGGAEGVAMLEGAAREFYLAMKEQALEEVKLGRHAVDWGRAHGKSAAVAQRVFVRVVDAAHRANTTDALIFTDALIADLYADEDAVDQATR